MPELLTDHWEENLIAGPWPAGKHEGREARLPLGTLSSTEMRCWEDQKAKSSCKAMEEVPAARINVVSQEFNKQN